MGLQGFYQWFQDEGTTAILIVAIAHTLYFGAWKRAFIKWAVGMLGLGLALVVVQAPEMLIGIGRWLAELFNIG